MKIRQGFVSNSSSSSFVVIDTSGYYTKYIPTGAEDVKGFEGETEFGWGPEIIRDVGSRINFAYLQTIYAKSINWLIMLEEVIKEETGIVYINWNLTTEYDTKERWGYIDHASSVVENENIEMFDNKQALKDFIFGKQSEIVLQNDNE